MELQLFFNIFLGISAFLGGFLVHRVFQTLDEIRTSINHITEKQNKDYRELSRQYTDLIADLPKIYATKNDVERMKDEIKEWLDKLEGKIDTLTEKLGKK